MIGIYAHHHGSGHMHRCRAIQRELRAMGYECEILSTAGGDVPLVDDASDAPRELRSGRAMTAGGTLHYAPYGSPQIASRFAQIAKWVADNQPEAFYVDVSDEVAVFVRLMGIPVVVHAMPGARGDAPHQLAYAQADAIVAAWPDWVPVPEHLRAHADRLHAVGGISRLTPREGVRRDPHHVVVMAGLGGSTWAPEDWAAVEAACPEYRFTFLGGDNHVDDPTELLQSAGIAVTAGGQNSVADLAATNTPAVILPQPRPFAEQKLGAKVLDGLATVRNAFPAPEEWPELLRRRDTDWARWQTEGAARRAAEVIAGVAEHPGQPAICVVTLADANRRDHLTHQVNLMPMGVDHVTVALADADVLTKAVPKSHVVAGPANLAAARNLGARTAIERGAEVLVFLDADCLASDALVPRYVSALKQHPDAVVAGPVTYLSEGEMRVTDPDPHPARPNPAPGKLVDAENYALFWSLSFALTAGTWGRIEREFGGFDSAYEGYGGEDTDFARELERHHIPLVWVGGAHAFHQWHPVSSPPWEHIEDIVANANRFHAKWGQFPMEGWLEAFEAEGGVVKQDAPERYILRDYELHRPRGE
ncbi:glycosyltransferase [Corynebacterium ureicelerivorans]|uniref:glycosyltransferase n=1 Tax=Corynebacterium ureicelerivorans TaxID=401472 RepID=UPI000A0116FC|nr:glycosyltransferase [Corynebacterium ureicelerivorans]